MDEHRAKDPFSPGRPQTADPEAVFSMRESGMTNEEVALKIGVTTRRVQQIVQAVKESRSLKSEESHEETLSNP